MLNDQSNAVPYPVPTSRKFAVMNSSSSALDKLDDTTKPWLHDSVGLSAKGMLTDGGQGSVPSNGDAEGGPLGICNVKLAGVTDGSCPCTMQIVALLTDGVMESLSPAIGVPCGGGTKIDSSHSDRTGLVYPHR